MQHDVQHEYCWGVSLFRLSGFWQRNKTGNVTNSEVKKGPVAKTGAIQSSS